MKVTKEERTNAVSCYSPETIREGGEGRGKRERNGGGKDVQ